MVYDLVIIGSGASGLAAGIYAGRYLMKTLVISGEFGGETATAGVIWNYPGVKGADGFELMVTMKEQAKEVGVEFVNGRLTSATADGNCFSVQVGERQYYAKTLLFAHGAERKHLGLPNEKELTSKGVHYCTTCDSPLYMGKTIAIVGGGDASIKGVLLAAQYAKKVYLLVRSNKLRAEPINVSQMEKLGDKVEVLYETEVRAIHGENQLEKIEISKEYNGTTEMVLDGLFIEIGARPEVEAAVSLGVALDDKGYIQVNPLCETNIAGVYASGDTVNLFGSFKQTITAAALGAVAATSAYNYYKLHGNLCEIHATPTDSVKTPA